MQMPRTGNNKPVVVASLFILSIGVGLATAVLQGEVIRGHIVHALDLTPSTTVHARVAFQSFDQDTRILTGDAYGPNGEIITRSFYIPDTAPLWALRFVYTDGMITTFDSSLVTDHPLSPGTILFITALDDTKTAPTATNIVIATNATP